MASREQTSRTLRVIGQMLETRGIDLFELKCVGDEFCLLCGDPTPPHQKLVELRYSATEIDSLDAAAKANRHGAFKLVNFEGLPEVLRTLGRRMDERRARLLRLTNSDTTTELNAIKIEYQTRDGQRHAEEISTAAIGDQALRLYKERRRRFDGDARR